MTRIRLLVALLLAAALAAPPIARASSFNVVISQVFGGGGNAGASFKNDFVELFNRGTTPVDLNGWTLQYATAAGVTWQSTALAGTLPPGGYYLVQLASGADVGDPLPLADASGNTNLSASSGKIALVRDGAALACGASAGSCSSNPLVEDLIGYGSASDFEGAAAAPGLSSTTAALRLGEGCVDTDSNAMDFAAGAPAPRNSLAPFHFCIAQEPAPPPAPAASASQEATVALDIQPVLTISLERSLVDFGRLTWNASPTPISEKVTIVSNDPSGYALAVHRSAFTPNDLPLALAATAPSGAQLADAFVGGSLVPIPIAPAPDLLIGSTTASMSADGGDVWSTSIGFAAPIPLTSAGRHTATLTFTVVGR